MQDRFRVVVVGGGVVGASVLYHLTKRGWTDVVLLERSELTSGSTWHAAGGMHTLNGDPNVAALQKYTVELYREIEQLSGHDCGISLTGGLVLAESEERMDWLRMAHARGRYLGMDTELLSVAEAKQQLPFMDEQYFVGALFDPLEGHVDPSGVTYAYARAAEKAGATVRQHTRVERIRQLDSGEWELDCGDDGPIICEHWVNAAGLWAREVGRMAGVEVPILAMEHHYLITEDIEELADGSLYDGLEGVHAMDFGGEVYMRQEGSGLLLGTYEPDGVPWSVTETPWDFGHQLLPPDLERIGEHLSTAFDHFPIFHEVGIRKVVNGPFTFAPDGNPLVGPVPGQRGHWSACGVMAGLSQGGGVGLALANWIVDGDPGFDVWGMDVARFGPWATPAYTHDKVVENYGRRFRIAYPNEELPAARRLITSPIYDRLDAAGAVWGVTYGLEHALWFSPDTRAPAEERIETPTLRRSNAFGPVAEEVAAVRGGVGLIETTGFAKYTVSGPGARAWLEHLLPNTLPELWRLRLTPMLDEGGRLIGDFTVAAVGGVGGPDAEDFMIFGSGVAEAYHLRWFRSHLPEDGSVRVRAHGSSLCGLSIAGPAARDVLADLVSPKIAAMDFLTIRHATVGRARALVGRISFTGDLGYEIWCEPGYLPRLFDDLMKAGAAHGIRLFGARALNSLRLDKSYGAWATEYRPIYTADEAGLGWAVKPEKGHFIGRDAVVAEREAGPQRRLVTFTVDVSDDPAEDGDVIGDEPIWHDGEVIGWVTSGGYAHHSRASVALGYVPAALAAATDGFQIELLGARRRATRVDGCLWDPKGARMRS